MSSNVLLLMGSFILLGFFTLTTNTSLIRNQQLSMESEYIITATGIAQEVIEEAKTKAFDQTTVAAAVTNSGNLTAPGSLGPDSGENMTLPETQKTGIWLSAERYNDIDDYNKYRRVVSTPKIDYNVSVVVAYVTPTNPDSYPAARTWAKRMTVTVTSTYLTFPVVLDFVFVY